MDSRLVRILIVIAGIAVAAIFTGPDLQRLFGAPLRATGVPIDYNYTVTAVSPQASAAGVRAGDRIDWPRASIEQRVLLQGAAGGLLHSLDVPLVRGSRHLNVRVPMVPEGNDRLWMVALRYVIQLLCIVLGTLVVLRRPSPATWGFFFFLLMSAVPVNIVYQSGPPWWRSAAYLGFYATCDGPIQWSCAIFALFVLQDGPLKSWRRAAALIVYALAAINVTAAVAYWWQSLYANGVPAAVQILYQSLGSAAMFVAVGLLAATYFELPAPQRERLRWIIAGFALGAIASIGVILSPSFLGVLPVPYTLYSVFISLQFAPPAIAVAYAILKHRVIDVDVAVTRATVYGALSVAIVGIFALVDMFFTRALAAKDAGWIADVGLALALGFSFNALHASVDRLVDRLLFRRRHLAEEYVASLTGAIAYATDESQVMHMLLDEPARAFLLADSWLVEADERGEFATEPYATLAALLRSERRAKRLSQELWGAIKGENGAHAAAAVPVFTHNALSAIAFFTPHRSGTDLDADELKLIEALAFAAGNSLERLESEAMRREIEVLRAERAAGPLGARA